MNISVVIPIYNEEENLALLYDELTGVMQSLDCSYEILFVDDGSTDQGADVLDGLPVRILRHSENLGKGIALQTAAREAAKASRTSCAMTGWP